MPAPNITRREWRNVAIFIIFALIITSLPYIVGWLSQRPDLRFTGFIFGLDDANSYLAKMREGADGNWLFHIVYTAEPHASMFIFVPYLLMGKLAALFAPPNSPALVDAMIMVFHAARLVFAALLIAVTYRFAAFFLVSPSARMVALVLITLGGGFGWVLTIVGQQNWLGSSPLDFIVPEGYSFYLIYGLPHLALARACLLGGFMLLFTSLPSHNQPVVRSIRRPLRAGLLWLIMGLCVPFYIAVLYILLGVWGLAAILKQRRFPVDLFWRCVVAALVTAPYLLYNLLGFAANPIMAEWQAQNLLPSPHPLHFLIGYGLLAVLAIPALRWAWQRGSTRPAYLLLLAWVIVAPILAYLPINVQRRLLEGVFVPLCILAIAGVRYAWVKRTGFRRQAQRWRSAVIGILVLSLPTTAILLFSGAYTASVPYLGNRLYNDTPLIEALDWLAANAPPQSVVLSNVRVGNYLPVRTSLLAYVGHGPETIGYAAKLTQAEQLLHDDLSESDRRALYASGRITYVIVSPDDRTAPAVLTAPLPDLDLIYDQGSYQIYKVR
ncbi:MAG: hypothetical protein KF716_08075 [Anaerolineae bacterium]|nr:hypothetical protein [Anaerolineae bacterium]